MNDEATRKKIVEGAKKLFQLYGFTRITIDEIAVNLKISKKTIYKHFNSKDDLIWAVIESIQIPLSASITEMVESGRGFHETLTGIIQILQTMPLHVTPPMFQDIRAMPHIWEKLDRRRKQMIEKNFGTLIERGQKNGDIRKDVEPVFIMNLIIHMVGSLVTPQVIIEFGMMPAELIHRLASILMTGILTEKARKKLGGAK